MPMDLMSSDDVDIDVGVDKLLSKMERNEEIGKRRESYSKKIAENDKDDAKIYALKFYGAEEDISGLFILDMSVSPVPGRDKYRLLPLWRRSKGNQSIMTSTKS